MNGFSSLRKAAVLVASLDMATADHLLDQMPEEQAALIRRMLLELDDVDPAEQQAVIAEFCGHEAEPDPATFAEVEDVVTLSTSSSEFIAKHNARVNVERGVAEPFQQLQLAPAHQLAALLSREHPQTVAVVVSHLPPQRAADVLDELDDELQCDVMRRLVDLEVADPEILREIESELQRWLQAPENRAPAKPGVAHLRCILEATEPESKRRLLSNIAERDPRLANRLTDRPPMVTFERVEMLDDEALMTVIRNADPQITQLALVGVSTTFLQRVLQNLPTTAAEALERSLNKIGPLRLTDVEEAKSLLGQVAGRLAAQGRIELPRFSYLSPV